MPTQTRPSIVFAHGLWADGSCFGKVIPALQADGHEVICSQNSLDTLKGDVDAVNPLLGRVSSPAILVGHSYGGTLITAAGTDDRVAGLVYIAALAPDETRPRRACRRSSPHTDVFAHIEVADGRIWLRPDGIGCFCGRPARSGAEARLGDPGRAGARSLQPEARRRRLGSRSRAGTRGQARPHRPPRAGTLRRQAHGRHDRRGRQQSRPDALQARAS